MACPIDSTCTFFNNQIRMDEERKKIIKVGFCLSSYSQCARYRVYEYFKSASKVPADLYPNNYEQANDLILANRKNHGGKH